MYPMQNKGYANNMTRLLNKIERRLGTKLLTLPEGLQKSDWEIVIIEDTLPTFSRYFPFKFRYTMTSEHNKDPRSDAYLIDEDMIPGNVTILGVRDFAWDNNMTGGGYVNQGVYGVEDWYDNAFSLEDIALVQCAANQVSLFNNGLFVEFEAPNKVWLKNCYNRPVMLPHYQLDVFVTHSPSLSTIEPTKMETFEALAMADVAKYLYEQLKYFEGTETIFANIDIRLSDLQDAASKRDDVIQKIEDGYVSAANKDQPIMYTV